MRTTLEALVDELFVPLLPPLRKSGYRHPRSKARINEHARWLTLNARWVEEYHADMKGHRDGPDHLDDPLCAPGPPRQLVEALVGDEVKSRAGRFSLRGMDPEEERAVEYLYRKASMQDRAAATEFGAVQRQRAFERLKRRVHLERLDRAYRTYYRALLHRIENFPPREEAEPEPPPAPVQKATPRLPKWGVTENNNKWREVS